MNTPGRKLKQIMGIFLLRLSALIIFLVLGILIFFLIVRGSSVLSWEFLTQPPKNGMTAGGIFPAILGTLYLTLGAMLFALPLGVLAAVYMTEYAVYGKIIRIIRIGISNLASVPSIVFGLFGLTLFVNYFKFGVSILSGSLTLGIMILPVIIRASEEALLLVPQGFREASLALGATKWQTIYKVVLPNAIGGIITGAILGVGRVAGETAPILFTAATFYTRKLPTSIFSEVMALPYHIYALMMEGSHPKEQKAIAYGAALVLLIMVLGINFIAVLIRNHYRRRKKW